MEYEPARPVCDIMLLDPILGRFVPLKVMSLKSRGGLNKSVSGRRPLAEVKRTHGGATRFFLSFLRLRSIQSNPTNTKPPTTPPTIPPIAPPLIPEDEPELDEAPAGAIVAATELELREIDDEARDEDAEAEADAEADEGTTLDDDAAAADDEDAGAGADEADAALLDEG